MLVEQIGDYHQPVCMKTDIGPLHHIVGGVESTTLIIVHTCPNMLRYYFKTIFMVMGKHLLKKVSLSTVIFHLNGYHQFLMHLTVAVYTTKSRPDYAILWIQPSGDEIFVS